MHGTHTAVAWRRQGGKRKLPASLTELIEPELNEDPEPEPKPVAVIPAAPGFELLVARYNSPPRKGINGIARHPIIAWMLYDDGRMPEPIAAGCGPRRWFRDADTAIRFPDGQVATCEYSCQNERQWLANRRRELREGGR
jgi:hypothetical protein